MTNQLQYTRKLNLIVADSAGAGLDLSQLRIVFEVKKTDSQTPNTAKIKIYNLSKATESQIQKEFTQVVLQAGYDSNFGVIFRGNIKQTRSGRENGTDNFLEIDAGDGDIDYNYAVVNKTLAAGSTQRDQIDAAAKPMTGTVQGSIDDIGGATLPRGKVMYGMSRDYLRQSAESAGASWSIQDGKLQIIKLTGTLQSQAVVLNSSTGLVGTPEQTNEGIKVKCLLNPLILIGGKLKIDEQFSAASSENGALVKIDADGIYRVLGVSMSGDTRGTDWYSSIVCIGVDAALPEGNQVKSNE